MALVQRRCHPLAPAIHGRRGHQSGALPILQRRLTFVLEGMPSRLIANKQVGIGTPFDAGWNGMSAVLLRAQSSNAIWVLLVLARRKDPSLNPVR